MTHLTTTLFSLVLSLLCTGASYANEKIGILVFDGVLTSDVTAPIEVFGAATNESWFTSYDVVTIAVSNEKAVKTAEGLQITADKLLADKPEVDVLLLPSAYDMEPLINNKELITYIQDTSKKAKWMASNCSGSSLLAEAGLLDGRKATTWAGGEDAFANAYPKVDVQHDVNYVIDGPFLTSNGGAVSYEAALALLSQLASQSKAQTISENLQLPRLLNAKLAQ
ncbi:MAG: transcriptional regulator [unclassified Hahellaceae]|nr:transcriptional regulator [Hahellaceae bacterium]